MVVLSVSSALLPAVAAVSASAATSPTAVRFTSPVTATGLAPGYRVTKTQSAECEDGSDSIAGAIYRCFAGSAVYDPCWRDPRAADGKDVVCLLRPGETSLTELTPTAPVAVRPATLEVDRFEPWGIELADGHKCLLAQGAHDTVGPPQNGFVVDWLCGGTLALLRGLHETRQPWTADEAIYSRDISSARFGPKRVPIAAVWYGVDGPASLAKLPALPFTGFPVWPPLAIGAVLVGTGAAVVAGSRRRTPIA